MLHSRRSAAYIFIYKILFLIYIAASALQQCYVFCACIRDDDRTDCSAHRVCMQLAAFICHTRTVRVWIYISELRARGAYINPIICIHPIMYISRVVTSAALSLGAPIAMYGHLSNARGHYYYRCPRASRSPAHNEGEFLSMVCCVF